MDPGASVNHASKGLVICTVKFALFRHQLKSLSLKTGQIRILVAVDIQATVLLQAMAEMLAHVCVEGAIN